MATVQTKIPFVVRKKLIASPRKFYCEKENNHKKLLASPIKSQKSVEKNEISRDFVLRVNSPSKRKVENSIRNFPSPDEGSPAKKEKVTPIQSSLLKRLTLDSPRIGSSTKKELFPCDDKRKVLKDAVRALHGTAPTTLPCRDDKLTTLRTFLETHSNDRTSGSLYISGPPGTGKTASLNLLLSQNQLSSKFKVITVNCTAVKSSTSLFSRVSEELKLSIKQKNEKTYLKAIEKYITSCDKMVLLILDELDQLESKKQSLLYTVFEWPSLRNSRLVLVGIANALDLTDRVLPRLQARVQLKPQLLHFPPYTRSQIIEIITQRLTEAGADKVFPGSALQLMASKVAAVSGDVRRALDTARRVIDVSYNQSINKDEQSSLISCTDKTEEISVTVKQVMDVVSNVYGTSQNLNCSEDNDSADSFPLAQKLLICSILLQLKQGKIKDINIGKLHEVYCRVCEKRNLVPVDISEFISLTSLVEARGVLRLQGKVKNRLSKISLQWDEKEMVTALRDKKLLSAVLDDKLCSR